MGIPTNYPGLTPDMVRLIKSRAYSLSRSYGHVPEDREDLEQNMALALLVALSRHDPEISTLRTFVRRVIDHWTSNCVEKRRAACRDYRRLAGSLDEPCVDDDGHPTTLGDVIGEDDTVGFVPTLGCIESAELRIEVQQIISTLPPKLRELCRQLMSTTPTDLCRATGVSRTTMAYRIEKIRKAFEDAGFRQKSSSKSARSRYIASGGNRGVGIRERSDNGTQG